MREESNIIVIELEKQVISLRIEKFDGEIDVENLLQVQRNDIMQDMITFPVLFNRFANMKAEADDLLRQAQFDTKVYEAQLYEEKKKELVKDNGKATEAAIENAIKRDINYQTKKKDEFKKQKQADIMDALYWAAKSKDKKLDAISAKVQPEEFEKEILEGSFNSVMMKAQKKTFKDIKR